MTPTEIDAFLAKSMGWELRYGKGAVQPPTGPPIEIPYWHPSDRYTDGVGRWSPSTDANDLLEVLCFHIGNQYGPTMDFVLSAEPFVTPTCMEVCVTRGPNAKEDFVADFTEPHDGTPESIILAAATALVRALEETP